MTHALGLARQEGFTWLLALDPDEFASGLDRDAAPPSEGLLAACGLRRLVAHVPPEPLQMVLATRECVPADLGDAPFWRQQYFQNTPVPRQIFDPVTGETSMWAGFLGHDVGKPLLRTTANALGYHSHRWVRRQATPRDRVRARRLVDDPLPTVTAGSLYHFNVVSAAHWRAKYLKVADEPAFWPSGHPVELPRQCWKRASRALDPAAAAQYFARWVALPDAELRALRAAGRVSVDHTVEAVLRAAGCLEGRPSGRALGPARPSGGPGEARDARAGGPRRSSSSSRNPSPSRPSAGRGEQPGHPSRVPGRPGEDRAPRLPSGRGVRGRSLLLGHARGQDPAHHPPRRLRAGRAHAAPGHALVRRSPRFPRRPGARTARADRSVGAVKFLIEAAAFPAAENAWLRLETSPVDTAAWPGEWRTLGMPIFELAFTPTSPRPGHAARVDGKGRQRPVTAGS